MIQTLMMKQKFSCTLPVFKTGTQTVNDVILLWANKITTSHCNNKGKSKNKAYNRGLCCYLEFTVLRLILLTVSTYNFI